MQSSKPYSIGNVIVLNGPSVAGKSSIQKKLQESFAEPYMAMGIDSILVAMLPTRYFKGAAPDREEVLYGVASTDDSGSPVFTLRFGPKGQRVMAGMHAAVAVFAEHGNNIIVDYILYEREWLLDLTNALRSVNAYFVGVRPPWMCSRNGSDSGRPRRADMRAAIMRSCMPMGCMTWRSTRRAVPPRSARPRSPSSSAPTPSLPPSSGCGSDFRKAIELS